MNPEQEKQGKRMKTTDRRRHRLTGAIAGVLGLLVVGTVAVPAQAEPARDMQWHLDAMRAQQMWEVSKGEGVTVAVIDTGVDVSLPDLKGQVLSGKDFTDIPGAAHDDYDGHGTSMASLIAATGAGGTARGTLGLAPEAKILPLRINTGGTDLADNAAEADREFAASMAPAIRFAADSDAKILSISQASRVQSPDIAKAVTYALSKGKLVFAGVGNSAEKGNPVMYPAALPGVVGVAATDREGSVTSESERGSQVDLSAPGDEMVYSCTGASRLCEGHGTSAATAIASASAALLWAEHPDWTANQIIRVLVETAGGPESGEKRTDSLGYGIVRPRIALLEGGVDPGDPETNPLPGPYYEGNPSSSERPSNGSDGSSSTDDQAAGPATGDSDSGMSTGEWIGYGLLAAVVLAGAIATPLLLARRKRNHTPPPPFPGYRSPAPPMPPTQPTPWNSQPPHHYDGDRH